MEINDFSKIRSIDELVRRKELLQRDIDFQEQELQLDLSEIRTSLGVFSDAFAKINKFVAYTRSNMDLFMMGYRYIKEWRERRQAHKNGL